MRSTNKPQLNSAPLVIYDADQDITNKCCICFLSTAPLINPCQCSMLYHQTCLLRYIRQKLLSMKQQLDFTQIKCKRCQYQMRFLYYQNTHYSCTYFCDKIRRNWCNKTLIVIIAFLLASIAMAIILANHNPEQGMVYYGLLIGETVLCLILFALIITFIQTNFTYKQIILVRVYQFAQLMRNNNTSSSDDSPHHNNIASDAFEIIIDQEY